MSVKYGQIHASQLARWAGWTGDEIAIAVYLRASKHSSTEGLSEIPVAYIAHDRRWETNHVEQILDRLVELGDILREGDWVLVLDALQHHNLTTKDRLKGAANRFADAPVELAIYSRFTEVVAEYCPSLLPLLPTATRVPPQGASGVEPECHPAAAHEPVESSRTTTTSTQNSRTDSFTPPRARAGARRVGAPAHEGPRPIETAAQVAAVPESVNGSRHRQSLVKTFEREVLPTMRQVAEWDESISTMGDEKLFAKMQLEPDAPWADAAAQALAAWNRGELDTWDPRAALRAGLDLARGSVPTAVPTEAVR